jgi:signal transduction histidine kinase
MPTAEAQAPPEELPTPEPAAKARRHVRNYLLDTSLQLRLASYLLGAATLLSLGLGWLLWSAYRETSHVLELADPSVGAALGTALAQEDRFRIVAVAVALVLVLCCLLGAAVVVTHRIAGPAYAIARTCRRVADGDLTEPRPLRSRDLLVDLGDEVSAMVRELRAREARERDLLAAAAEVLRDPFSPAQTRQELARQLESLASDKERRLTP